LGSDTTAAVYIRGFNPTRSSGRARANLAVGTLVIENELPFANANGLACRISETSVKVLVRHTVNHLCPRGSKIAPHECRPQIV
jgi:hypothetical protein